ncbi:hypothetical protein Mapa_016856 [Marchantia paleacea]|nr:hypothetical protein Mapa_016856 [Marchantia paleacea]
MRGSYMKQEGKEVRRELEDVVGFRRPAISTIATFQRQPQLLHISVISNQTSFPVSGDMDSIVHQERDNLSWGNDMGAFKEAGKNHVRLLILVIDLVLVKKQHEDKRQK